MDASPGANGVGVNLIELSLSLPSGFGLPAPLPSASAAAQGYTTARLPRFGEGDPAHKPNTSCLCVGPDGALLTYASSSWAVRSAFNAQLWPPFARARKAFPVVTIGWRSLARCLRSR